MPPPLCLCLIFYSLVTVTEHVSVLPLHVAVTVAEPAAKPVTTPALDTLAYVPPLVTSQVTTPAAPFGYNVASSCAVSPSSMLIEEGEAPIIELNDYLSGKIKIPNEIVGRFNALFNRLLTTVPVYILICAILMFASSRYSKKSSKMIR